MFISVFSFNGFLRIASIISNNIFPPSSAGIGNKLMSTSNYFEQATAKKEGLKSSFVTSFREGIQEKFLAQQQRAYGLSLQKLTSLLDEEQALKAQQL